MSGTTTLQQSHDPDGPRPHLVIMKAAGPHRIGTLAYLPNGRIVISAEEGTIRVLNVEDGKQEGTSMKHGSEVCSLAVTQDGTKIVSSDIGGVITVWDVESHKLVRKWAQPGLNKLSMISISTNDRLVAIGNRWAVFVHSIEDEWQMDQTIKVDSAVLCLSFSPDGDQLACGTMDGIRVYNLKNGSLVFGSTGHQQWIWSLLWSHDGGRLFSGSYDSIIRHWNYDTGEPIGHQWIGHSHSIHSLRLSPDGSILASASSDHTVRFWNTSTSSPIGQPLRHEGFVDEICFSPSGEVLASVGSDGTLYLWRVPPIDRPLTPTQPNLVHNTLSHKSAPPPDLTAHISRRNDRYIAGGGFGDVYRCWYRQGSPKEVAVKAFRFSFALDGDVTNSSHKMLRRELGIWRRLKHDNIVPFLGIAYGFGMLGAMSLVSLWMPNGSLHHFMQRHHDKLDPGHRLQFLLDITSGLDYLHSFSNPIVHGDLNGNNILLDENYTARLADFGYASLVGNIPEALMYLQRSTTRPGALRWIAPEQIESEETFTRTTKSDIYALGCIALQVLSGKQPWSEVREDAAVVLRLARGHKPGRPVCDTLQDAHWDMIQRCWSSVDERPPAEDIISCIQRFLRYCPSSRPLCDVLGSQPIQHTFFQANTTKGAEKDITVTSTLGQKRPHHALSDTERTLYDDTSASCSLDPLSLSKAVPGALAHSVGHAHTDRLDVILEDVLAEHPHKRQRA